MKNFKKWMVKHKIITIFISSAVLVFLIAGYIIPIDSYKGYSCGTDGAENGARYSILLLQYETYFEDKENMEQTIDQNNAVLNDGGCPLIDNNKLFLI